MKTTLDSGQLERLCDFLGARMALRFPRERWGELETKVGAAAVEFGRVKGAEFVEWLLSSTPSREQIEILASHLTIGETYFWREPEVFAALEGLVLPELIRSRDGCGRRLRIWSAGCATGEEAYSLAIAVRRALPALEDWHVTILATDINPRVLRRAAVGVYGGWSFRNAPRWLTRDYFTLRADGKRELSAEIRRMVSFAYLNLAQDIYPAPVNNTNAMDIVFCRNVLMYFSPESARLIVEKLFQSLVPDGWLVVSATELSQEIFPQFTPVHSHGAIVYRKESGSAAAHGRAPPPPVFCPEPPPFEPAAAPGLPAPPSGTGPPEPLAAAAPPPAAVSCPGVAEVRALANRGLLAEALAACAAAIAADKVDPGLQHLRAVILQELDRRVEAIAALRSALYLDPDFVLAHFSLGNLLLREKRTKAARKCFENVSALLAACPEETVLPESEGLTAGRLREIVHATLEAGAPE